MQKKKPFFFRIIGRKAHYSEYKEVFSMSNDATCAGRVVTPEVEELESPISSANRTNRNTIFSKPVRAIKVCFLISPSVIDDDYTCTALVAKVEI